VNAEHKPRTTLQTPERLRTYDQRPPTPTENPL
jgi:hypothetical protein